LGIGIADTFAHSTRQARQGMRTRIFSEWRIRSAQHTVIFAVLGLFLWAGDLAMDASQAKKALAFRLCIAALLLLSALAKWLSTSLWFNYIAAYVSLALCEAVLVGLFKDLEGGRAAMAGQFLYFFIGSLAFCALYSFKLNLYGCATLVLVPHLCGVLLIPDFPHILYAAVIWPASLLTVLVHWWVRPILVENIKLRQEIESSTAIDPVTGLLNMRGLEQAFQRLVKLGTAKPLQQFLLLIEIDGWDEIRRTYGDDFARSLRWQIGQTVDVSFRGRDVTASPGNEFVCILQHVSREKAFEIAERFRELVASKEFACATAKTGKLRCTVSAGIVSADTREHVRALLNRARVGISQARAAGGNQCACI